MIATKGHPRGGLRNTPPARGIEKEIEVRLNNLLLEAPRVDDGWLVFRVDPVQCAVGDNLVGVRVKSRPPGTSARLLVEKLELHVDYREGAR